MEPSIKLNPARIDPTRTKTLRDKFAADLRGRFDRVAAEVNVLLLEERVFGDSLELSVNSRWSFLPLGNKLDEFRKWLMGKLGEHVLSRTVDGYVEEAYDKGALRSASSVLSNDPSLSLMKPGDVVAVLRPKLALEKLAIMKMQSYNALVSVSEAVASKVSDVLAVELVRGSSPRDMAKAITDSVKSIGRKRATTLARTETIRAHAEGALDVMEQMGVSEIGVEVEWSTTGDGKVCPKCRPLEGVILPIAQAHGMFPRHPNCRCSPVPAFEVVNRKKIQMAVDRSLAAGRSKKGKSENTDWPGLAIQSYLSEKGK